MNKRQLSITGMSCGHCVAAVRSALESVESVSVSDVTIGQANIELASGSDIRTVLDAVKSALEDEGYGLAETVDASGGEA